MMTPSTSKPTLAEIAVIAVRCLNGEHGLFLATMAMVAGVLVALNGGVMR